MTRSSVAVRGRCSTRVRRVRQQSDGNVLPESYHALVRWSQNQPQPCRLVPDPYNLSHVATSASTTAEHCFLESSARADCLVVGDYVASFSLDRPQSYTTISIIF